MNISLQGAIYCQTVGLINYFRQSFLCLLPYVHPHKDSDINDEKIKHPLAVCSSWSGDHYVCFVLKNISTPFFLSSLFKIDPPTYNINPRLKVCKQSDHWLEYHEERSLRVENRGPAVLHTWQRRRIFIWPVSTPYVIVGVIYTVCYIFSFLRFSSHFE